MLDKSITHLDCQPSCGSPCTKGTVSSFCSMIKKAVRDLHPCGLSTRRGISKYIDMRYGMKDNCLLNCSLKWLVCSGILRRKCGLYSFCCSSKIVKNELICKSSCKPKCCKPCCKPKCYKPCCKSRKCKPKFCNPCKPKCCKLCCKPKCCKPYCKPKRCKPKCCKPCCKPKCYRPCKSKCCKPCCKPKCCVPKCKPRKKRRSRCCYTRRCRCATCCPISPRCRPKKSGCMCVLCGFRRKKRRKRRNCCKKSVCKSSNCGGYIKLRSWFETKNGMLFKKEEFI